MMWEWLVSIDAVPFIIGRNDDCHLKLIDKRIGDEWVCRLDALRGLAELADDARLLKRVKRGGACCE